MVELRDARRAAARIGLGLHYVLKEARLFDILEKLGPFWLNKKQGEPLVVLKGGTALNKVFLGSMQRFSEDIDFDGIFENDPDRARRIEYIKTRLLPALEPEYSIPREHLMRSVVRFDCGFTNELSARDNIRVEFNIQTPLVGEVETKEAQSEIFRTSTVRVQTYSLSTLVAKKIKAFYERESGKDIYDMYRGLRAVNDNARVVGMLKEVLAAERIDYGEFKRKFPAQLEDRDKIRRVHGATNPYVPRALRIDWVAAAREVKGKLEGLL